MPCQLPKAGPHACVACLTHTGFDFQGQLARYDSYCLEASFLFLFFSIHQWPQHNTGSTSIITWGWRLDYTRTTYKAEGMTRWHRLKLAVVIIGDGERGDGATCIDAAYIRFSCSLPCANYTSAILVHSSCTKENKYKRGESACSCLHMALVAAST